MQSKLVEALGGTISVAHHALPSILSINVHSLAPTVLFCFDGMIKIILSFIS